jgi:hypothetical protein
MDLEIKKEPQREGDQQNSKLRLHTMATSVLETAEESNPRCYLVTQVNVKSQKEAFKLQP